MKICVLGDTSGSPDEGMKKIVVNLASELARDHEVLVLNPLEVLSCRFWKATRDFRPDVVHYVPGPSPFSFLIAKTISLLHKPALTVMSVTLAGNPALVSICVRLFKPTLVLTQSSSMYELIRKTGQRVSFLPISGVDLNRFKPVSRAEKIRLREKFHLEKDTYIVLHVGHLKSGRNLESLAEIQKRPGNQVVVVGSTSTIVDKSLVNSLERKGFVLMSDYCPDIHELYGLADCYVFPVKSPHDSVEIPLSIIEALASGLPIVSTRFGGVEDVLVADADTGVVIVDSTDEISPQVERLKTGTLAIRASVVVSRFSWEKIAASLITEYRKTIEDVTGRLHDKDNGFTDTR